MSNSVQAKITLSRSKFETPVQVDGIKLLFSAHRCFHFDGDSDEERCLDEIVKFLKGLADLAFAGCGEMTRKLLDRDPALARHIRFIISDDQKLIGQTIGGLKVQSVERSKGSCKNVFHGETLSIPRRSLEGKLRALNVAQFGPEVVLDRAFNHIPKRAWSTDPDCIYPIDIPEIEFQANRDFILIDCPARNLSLMPNGLAYVHNALKKAKITFQTVDLDIIVYHQFHTHRLLDAREDLKTPSGAPMHTDPWLAEAYDEWQNPDVIAYFNPVLEEIAEKLIAAKPKVLGCSIHACNHKFTEALVKRVKAALPDTLILVGGYSCYQPTIGLRAFPLADYMCIGEADFTVGPLLEQLAAGERPHNMPGIMSVFDTPGWIFDDKAAMPMELDEVEMATYDWTDLKLYRNHNHYQLTPIIATRGCRWSKCTFCAERFYWRARDPKKVVDEFEYLHDHGCDLFMFNESDLNGRPDLLLQICEEIQRRKLKIKLTGQLRINRHSDRKFFDAIRAGGFEALRFGVDAWSANTLRLQMKGYTVGMIEQNLRDCVQAGITTEVNTVIGIPGETDQDIVETIELKAKCLPWVGRVANVNALMLLIGSVYWEKPEKFGIKFKGGTKEEMFKRFPRYVPDDFWYSESPYIDGKVRVERFLRVIAGMTAAGYDTGPFADRAIAKISTTGENQLDEGVLLDIDEETRSLIMMSKKGQKAAEAPIRVSCALPVEKVSREAPSLIVRKNDEYFGVFKMPDIGKQSLSTIVKSGLRYMKNNASQSSQSASTSIENHALATHWHADLAVRQQLPRYTQIQVKRDFGPLTRLIQADVHGYNIVQVRTDFYAVKHGFEFDKERADLGLYPADACYRGQNGREVMSRIEALTTQV